MTSRSSGDPRRDLREAACEHAASLHRTAVMITGAPETAIELVVATFDRVGRARGADGSGTHVVTTDSAIRETLLGELVREHLRHARQGRSGQVPWAGGLSDAVDVLHSLGPRQRAAAVLVLVEGWSDDDAGLVLGVSPRRVSSLVPRTEGLAQALEAVADQDTTPSLDVVATVLASLAQEPTDIGPATTQEEATGPRRWTRSAAPAGPRRGLRRLAAAAVLVLATLTAVALLADRDDATRRPVAAVDGAGSTSLPDGMSERGWVLDDDDDPPAQLEGLQLVETITIDYADATRPLALRTQPLGGYAVHAALWCHIPAVDPNLTVPTATLSLSGATVELPCAGKGGEPEVRRLVPLPPRGLQGQAPASITWTGDLPDRGTAVLATYTEPEEDEASERASTGRPGLVPPLSPVVLPDAPPSPPKDSAVLDHDSLGQEFADVEIFVQRVVVSPETRLSLWTGQTGHFMVLVDGLVASDDGDTTERLWREQDPELRQGWWMVHAPGRVKEFGLPERIAPAAGETREVTLQARVESAPEGRWQVQASHASPVAMPSPTPIGASATDAPTEHEGHQLLGAWEVPVDGYPHPLVTPPTVSPDTMFTVQFYDAGVFYPDWRHEAAVSSDLGTTHMPNGPDQYWALHWLDAWPGWEQSGPALGEVSVSVFGHSADGQATVLAYQPEP